MTPPIDFIERSKCEICSSHNYCILLSRNFSDVSIAEFLGAYYKGRIDINILRDAMFEIRKCKECGFVWQGYALNDVGMGELYNKWISEEESLKKKQKWGTSPHEESALEIGKFFQKPKKDIKVLDFGMGWGFWCVAAKKEGFEVYGFEISLARIDYAKKMGINVINWDEISQNGPYDFINADQVFEHISNPLETLQFLNKNLQKGGILRMSVPNGLSVARDLLNPKWKASKNYIQPLEHINCFTFQTLKLLGVSCGLSAVWPKTIKSILKFWLSRYSPKMPLVTYFKK